MEAKIRKPYEAQLDEDREFYSAAHRTGYDQGFTAGIDYQICLEQSLGVFSKDSQIYHLGNRIGELNAIVSDANTALEALVAERTELQTQLTDALAQLTQLRSQTIAREDVALPEGAVIPEGYQPLPKGKMVPKGAMYWVKASKRWVEMTKEYPRFSSNYYIRPAKEVSNG